MRGHRLGRGRGEVEDGAESYFEIGSLIWQKISAKILHRNSYKRMVDDIYEQGQFAERSLGAWRLKPAFEVSQMDLANSFVPCF